MMMGYHAQAGCPAGRRRCDSWWGRDSHVAWALM